MKLASPAEILRCNATSAPKLVPEHIAYGRLRLLSVSEDDTCLRPTLGNNDRRTGFIKVGDRLVNIGGCRRSVRYCDVSKFFGNTLDTSSCAQSARGQSMKPFFSKRSTIPSTEGPLVRQRYSQCSDFLRMSPTVQVRTARSTLVIVLERCTCIFWCDKNICHSEIVRLQQARVAATAANNKTFIIKPMSEVTHTRWYTIAIPCSLAALMTFVIDPLAGWLP